MIDMIFIFIENSIIENIDKYIFYEYFLLRVKCYNYIIARLLYNEYCEMFRYAKDV